VFWVVSVYFNLRNTLPNSGTFLLGHLVYELAKSYFRKRTADMSTNTLRIEKEISRGCPQGSCSGPGMWNLKYTSLLKLKCMDRTKVAVFEDDSIIATRGGSVKAVENYLNVELCKMN